MRGAVMYGPGEVRVAEREEPRLARPGGHVGFVGVAHGVELQAMDLFWSLEVRSIARSKCGQLNPMSANDLGLLEIRKLRLSMAADPA